MHAGDSRAHFHFILTRERHGNLRLHAKLRSANASAGMSTLSEHNLQMYLQRIRVAKRRPAELSPSLSTLTELQLAHLKHIPFENLSLHHPKAS